MPCPLSSTDKTASINDINIVAIIFFILFTKIKKSYVKNENIIIFLWKKSLLKKKKEKELIIKNENLNYHK